MRHGLKTFGRGPSMKKAIRYYGTFQEEFLDRCIAGVGQSQCLRSRGENGLFCGQHTKQLEQGGLVTAPKATAASYPQRCLVGHEVWNLSKLTSHNGPSPIQILWLSWGKREVAHATKADASYVRSGAFPALCGIRIRDAWDCDAGELPRVERSTGGSASHIRSCQRCVDALARLQKEA